ncbi:MAG: PAS domain S-box protein [Magnetovibrionaceae bacterium]
MTRPGNGFFLAALLFGVGFMVGLYVLIERYQESQVEFHLRHTAAEANQVLSDFRSFYSSEVVGLLEGSDVTVSHDFRNLENAIPLPATLALEYSAYLRRLDRSLQFELVSDYPFSWREDRQLSAFARGALDQLVPGKAESFYRFEVIDGERQFLFASPVPMAADCVACHNSWEGGPKTDWEEGDIRGVQIVSIDVDAFLAETHTGGHSFPIIIAYVLACFMVSIGALFFLLRRNRVAFEKIETLADAERVKNVELARSKTEAESIAARLSALMATMADGFLTIRPDGIIEDANEAALSVFDYSAEQLIGRNVSMLMTDDHRSGHDSYLRDYLEAGDPDRARILGKTRELTARRRSGEAFPIELTVTEVRWGDTLRFAGMVRDISERKHTEESLKKSEAEAKLLSLVAARTDNGVIITDSQGYIEWINEGFSRITGYELDEVVGHKPGRMLQGPDTDPVTVARIREAIAARQSFSAELLNYKKSGEPYWIAIDAQPLMSADGMVERFIAIERDISDIKQREAELETARENAEVANKAKSEFLATMSHEIRTPMNGVIGMTGLLLDTELQQNQRHFAETIRESGEALLNLINNILDFSKMEAGRLELENEAFDLAEMVESAVELMAPRAQEKNISLTAYVEPELYGLVRGDSGRLRQIVLNLLGNGVKFTPEGAVSLEVRNIGDELVRFEFRDTGIGIAEVDQSRLFKSFSQVDASTARQFEGTGLGLAICKQIVDLMGGKIGVSSVPGEGSLFWFEVSLPKLSQPVNGDDTKNSLAGMFVLLADPVPQAADVFTRLLTDRGARVVVGHSLAETAELIEADAPDVLILDTAIGALDGAGDLIRANPGVPTILLSNSGASAFEALADVKNVRHRLSKPPRLRQLLDALQDCRQSNAGAGETETGANHDSARMGRDQKQSSLRILLAEDNWVNQEVAVGMLNNLGHRVDVVANGREAVDAVAGLPYDLVLMDVQMPEMDGYEATLEIRKLEGASSQIPIIAMTANAMKGDDEKCFAVGMNGYLSKPVDKNRLYDALLPHAGLKPGTPTPEAATLAEANEAPVETSEPVGGSDLINESMLNSLVDELGAPGVHRLVGRFAENLPGRLVSIEAAVEKQDLAALAREAHSLKGVAATLGVTALEELARDLETQARDGMTDDVKLVVERLGATIDPVLAALTLWRSQAKV